MTSIQIIFLFSSYKKLSSEESFRIKQIVAEEYALAFACGMDSVKTTLCDAFSEGNKNDIVLAVETDKHIANEGLIRGAFKTAVKVRFDSLAVLKKMGYTGAIGIQSGPVQQEKEPANTKPGADANAEDPMDYRTRAKQYVAEEPKYSFSRLIIPEETLNQINSALDRIRFEREVFDEWGLYAIMPSPVSAMSFYGPPGTGKSMAADAIASLLQKKIIRASYADIENKYVGEGPKNVSAIFLAAEEQDAVLFIDEADSLLSKRLVNVSDPSGQAMNSMRSQLLISLEKFHGVVIFATNLAVNYDRAFVSRLINVKFVSPDAESRSKIWRSHLLPDSSEKNAKWTVKIPLADNVDIDALGNEFVLCGRDIRSAVVDACVAARSKGMPQLDQETIRFAAQNIVKRNEEIAKEEDQTAIVRQKSSKPISPEARKIIAEAMDRQNEAEKVKTICADEIN